MSALRCSRTASAAAGARTRNRPGLRYPTGYGRGSILSKNGESSRGGATWVLSREMAICSRQFVFDRTAARLARRPGPRRGVDILRPQCSGSEGLIDELCRRSDNWPGLGAAMRTI
jgi:hypothetical protein